MKNRIIWRDLLEKPFDQLLTHDFRKPRHVVNRLVGIECRTLTAGPITGIDEMAPETEQPKLKNGKECNRPAADNDNIILRFGAHHITISFKT